MKTLFCIPSSLSEDDARFHSPYVQELLGICKHYIVENSKPSRHFIKRICPEAKLTDYQLLELKEGVEVVSKWMDTLTVKEIGLLSDAGSPCLADPGGLAVTLAHQKGWRVVPLPGPSSILLALMASGFNGQQFSFHGYVPIDKQELKKTLLDWEKKVEANGYTQIFMETPYRNEKLIDLLCAYLSPGSFIHFSAGLLGEAALSKTIQVKDLQLYKEKIAKLPCIYLLGKPLRMV